MLENIISFLIVLAILGSGVVTGILFVFSNFAMQSFEQLQPSAGILAMQYINRKILNPIFFLFFMGTALLSLVLPLLLQWSEQVSTGYAIAGSILYLTGIMLVTITRNIPMNNALDSVDANTQEAGRLWDSYLIRWTNWNHIRTVAGALATVCFTLALI
ncbi:MAG: anthrone oxygenase family protein [Chloroflexota bacterium]